MEYSALDDETLIRQIAAARTEALGTLYDRYARLVFSLAYHAVGNYATAEEITQDVFTSIWEKAATYRPEQGKVSTWLTSITRYRAIDRLRRQRVRPEGHTTGWEEGETPDWPDGMRVEETVETSQERRRVRAAMAQLPREQQEALALAFFQGYTHQEIAALLNQPLGTVKTRIRMGMQKLRRLIEGEDG